MTLEEIYQHNLHKRLGLINEAVEDDQTYDSIKDYLEDTIVPVIIEVAKEYADEVCDGGVDFKLAKASDEKHGNSYHVSFAYIVSLPKDKGLDHIGDVKKQLFALTQTDFTKSTVELTDGVVERMKEKSLSLTDLLSSDMTQISFHTVAESKSDDVFSKDPYKVGFDIEFLISEDYTVKILRQVNEPEYFTGYDDLDEF